MMAEVLPPLSDNQDFYSPTTHSFYLHHTDLDMASSILNLGSPAQPDLDGSTAKDDSNNSFSRSHGSTPSPRPSSRASTSDLSNMLSMVTPPSSISSSLEDKYRQELVSDDDYPRFDPYEERCSSQLETVEEDRRRNAPQTMTTAAAAAAAAAAAVEDDEEQQGGCESVTTASDISLPTPTPFDDTAMRQEPSQHVDYLSHNWREEDVWSSWRHIVSQRKVYGQQSRLENAAWRTWIKNKYHLRTVSPETLNWLKESDVTWLYGPLKPAQKHPITQPESNPSSRLSKNNSFTLNKKPILKKRSMSEVMLQRSLSTSSLVKQAAASVQAQGRQRLDRLDTDYISSGVISEVPSREEQSSVDGTGSSGTETPSEGGGSRHKKHIRFDDTVEQCIAVDMKHDEDDFEESEDEEEAHFNALSSSSSDEGLVMMRKKPRRPGMNRSGSSRGSRSSSHQGRKTIETLPSTTLKYRTDSPDVSEQQQQQAAMSRNWGIRPKLSPSASQETLRPSRPSRNFLLGTDEEQEDDETSEGTSWSFGASNPRSSLGAAASSSSDALSGLGEHDTAHLPRSRSKDMLAPARTRMGTPRASFDETSREAIAPSGAARQLPAMQSEPGAYGMAGMRRTESGMFMPEDDEDDMMATGLFGRISETVNTARDIAHVIWNVGWRK